MLINRVSHEEKLNKKRIESMDGESINPDDNLHKSESIISDFTHLVSNSDQLAYISTLSGIILATVIITLFRSFYFFSVSIFVS